MTLAGELDDPFPWTLQEHLDHGRAALTEIGEDDERSGTTQPVCHHFWARADSIEELEDRLSGRTFGPLIERFEQIGLRFEADRLEAWEEAKPDLKWLTSRIPEMFALAETSNLAGYHGWTWEPKGRQPIGACEFQVINNRGES